MVAVEIAVKTDNIEEIKKIARENLRNSLALIGMAAEANAVFEITALGAVDTGNLRRSIEHGDNDVDEVYVGTNVEYGKYVEFGTSNMASRPFLKQALLNHIDEYESLLGLAMRGQ